MAKKALILLANGFEEIEAVAPIDLLRRADIDVLVASCENQLSVIGRSNLTLKTDCLVSEMEEQMFDLLVLPGGPAVYELRKKPFILKIIQHYNKKKKWIGAICAAPLLLMDAKILEQSDFTAHASVMNELPQLNQQKDVVLDKNLITSSGAGTAVVFALALVEVLTNSENAKLIADSVHAHFQPICK